MTEGYVEQITTPEGQLAIGIAEAAAGAVLVRSSIGLLGAGQPLAAAAAALAGVAAIYDGGKNFQRGLDRSIVDPMKDFSQNNNSQNRTPASQVPQTNTKKPCP